MGKQWRRGLWAALFLAFFTSMGGLAAWAQPVAFDVPETVSFAGQQLALTPGARAVVQKHGQQLVRNPKFYRSMTERADAYFPHIERAFREQNVPDDFKFLAIQESGLVSDVISRSNAVGYWQFKAETARELGLRIDPEVDERMHILASSRAAARYLSKNNQFLNNWTFALLSYYAGLGGCRAIVRADLMGATEMELDTTTHFYILKFLAHKLAFEQAVNRSPNPALSITEMPACEGKTLHQIAAETNVDIAQIEFYNKWCRTGMVPQDRDYSVMIPVQGAANSTQQPAWMAMTTRPTPPQLGENLKPYKERYFFGLLEREPEPATPGLNQETPVFFRWNGIKAILARKSDNINKLALAAGITKEALMDYNDLRIFDLIVPGQVYYVKSKRRKAKVPFHTVRAGESVWEVAQNYGITLEAILRKNRMRMPEKLAAGRILWLRHIRPEDHPIEYDPAVQQAPPVLPASKPLQQQALASLSKTPNSVASQAALPHAAAPASAVITYAPSTISQDSAAPTLPELQAKYKAIATNLATEDIAELGVIDAAVEQPSAAQPAALPTKLAAVDTSLPIVNKQNVQRIAEKPKPAAVPASRPKTVDTSLPTPKTHTVQLGETLYAIARTYGLMVADVKAANPNAEAGLAVGQVVVLPAKADIRHLTDYPGSKPDPRPATKTETKSEAPTHIVQAGETLYAIARKYSLTTDALKALNTLGNAPLSIGQVLKVK